MTSTLAGWSVAKAIASAMAEAGIASCSAAVRAAAWASVEPPRCVSSLCVKPGLMTVTRMSRLSCRSVFNAGALTHEAVVLPLPASQAVGEWPIGAQGRIAETGSLGEASRSCGAGEGDGITSGTMAWTTLRLQPGRYELVCNLPGHYAAGMYTELDVTR
ncbi:sulfocyanin-like copper-binding protein [Streptomyces sp. NPDC059718]